MNCNFSFFGFCHFSVAVVVSKSLARFVFCNRKRSKPWTLVNS